MPVPLGDSITEITCWRAYVWDDLAAANLSSQVQYVGSQNSNPQNCKPQTSSWDQHHEGHSGWLAIDIANNYIASVPCSSPLDPPLSCSGSRCHCRIRNRRLKLNNRNWIKNTPADIVMFMLGTNDVTRGNTAAQITAAYTKIVQTVRANNPKAKFIVSIPRLSFSCW